MKKENLSDWIKAIRSGINLHMRNQRVRFVEKKFGCDFGGHIRKKDLGYGQGEGYDYTPSPDHIKVFCSKSNISSDDSIIDIGCGKGYAMYLMGKYPFRKVGGVEKNSDLAAVAKKNMLGLDRDRYKVFEEDATNMASNPKLIDLVDEASYFYMYNPFPANIVSRVIGILENSAIRNARTIRIWYAAPDADCYEVLLNNKSWRQTWQGRSHGQMIYIFESK